jgi:hypothetical protein
MPIFDIRWTLSSGLVDAFVPDLATERDNLIIGPEYAA